MMVLWLTIGLSILYWSIVDLQCCVNFCCTAKWLSYTHTHMHTRIHTHTYIPFWFHFNWASQLLDNSREVFSEEWCRCLYFSRYVLFFLHVPLESLLRKRNAVSVERASTDLLDHLFSESWCNGVTTVCFWCCGVVLLEIPGWHFADITLGIDYAVIFFL